MFNLVIMQFVFKVVKYVGVPLILKLFVSHLKFPLKLNLRMCLCFMTYCDLKVIHTQGSTFMSPVSSTFHAELTVSS